MEIDVNVDGSDFEEAPPPKKTAARRKKAVQTSNSDDSEEPAPKKSATTRARKAAPAKKAPAKGRGKKTVMSNSSSFRVFLHSLHFRLNLKVRRTRRMRCRKRTVVLQC
jgi:hypothetical protein